MLETPIMVKYSGQFYAMIGISGSNGVLCDNAGVITIQALTSITIVETLITNKVDYLRENY